MSRETPERYKLWSRTDEALLESEPYSGPLLINIRHRSTGEKSEYNIRIGTMADTWFQQTEIGERDRERLGAFLRRVSDSFDLIETDYESNMYALPNYPELQIE